MNAFKEGVKELLRTFTMALIPLVIELLKSGEITWPSVLIAMAIALLSGIDKFLHKSDTGLLGNGLTGF